MSLVTIDLTKNPEIAALLSEAEPGKKVYGCFSVKSSDSQTATLRIEEMSDSPDDLDKTEDNSDEEDTETDDNAEEDAAEGETNKSPEGEEGEPRPAMKADSLGKKIAARVASGDTGNFQ